MKVISLLVLVGTAIAECSQIGWGGQQGAWSGQQEGWGIQAIQGLHKYGAAPLAHDGNVIDTPEVAHAKAEHFKAHAAAAHGSNAGGFYGQGVESHGGNGEGNVEGYFGGNFGGHGGKWHGPIAHIELTHDGKFVKDTPEVAHAKAKHFAALSAAKGGSSYENGYGEYEETYGGGYQGYQGDQSGQYKGEGEQEGQYKGEGEENAKYFGGYAQGWNKY